MIRWLPIALLASCQYTSHDFERHYIEVACDRLARCPNWVSETGQDCVRERQRDFGSFFDTERTFDPGRASDCLNDLVQQECEAGVLPYDHRSCQQVYSE